MKKIIIPNRNLQTKVNAFETRVLGSAGGVVIDKNRMLKTMVDFEDATILFTSNGYRSGRLQNVIPNTTAGDFTFNRNSQAGIINSAGAYELVANNIPRLDWKTGKPALLNENQATNLCFPSDVAVTQNISTLLDALSRPHWLSFIGTGSVTVSGSGTATLNGTGASSRVFLSVLCSTGTATLTPSGDVREIQFERNFFPSSYIPTTVSAVTRLAEDTRVTSASALIGQNSGTLYCEFLLTQNVTLSQSGKSLINIAFNNADSFLSLSISEISNTPRIILSHRNNGSAVVRLNTSGAPAIALGYHKLIVTYTALTTGVNYKIFLDGTLVQSSTATELISTGLNQFRVGGESTFYAGTNDLIFKSAHWNYALTDAKCQRLTTIL